MSGQPGRTWLHFMTLPCASGAQSVFSSSTVMQSAQLFLGFTMIARPSYAIGSSMYSTLLVVHSSTSVGLIGREASEMSVSPAQNFLKPPPVPEMPTVIFTSRFFFWNSSATASVIGIDGARPVRGDTSCLGSGWSGHHSRRQDHPGRDDETPMRHAHLLMIPR